MFILKFFKCLKTKIDDLKPDYLFLQFYFCYYDLSKNEYIKRPILRGRDIKRYSHSFADLFLITTFPSLRIDIEKFSAVKDHLLSFGYDRLKQTGDIGARKKTHNQWFETQDSISYWDDFSKQKIIYPEITKFLNFYFDDSGFFANNKCFILSGKNLYYLISFFNSSLFKYAFKDDFPELLGGSRELRKVFIEQIPIVEVDEKTNLILKELVLKCQNLNDDNFSKKEIEKKIDNIIFNHFDLTQDEIDAIGFIEIR